MEKNRVDEFIERPKKALFTLAIPITIGMSVQIMYNIVDTAFVGRLGADSIAALTFSFPLFFILMSLNSGIGVGMSSRISRLLGTKNKEEAENTAIHGLIISVVLAVLISIVGILTLKPLFLLFGASETVVPLAISFMSIILFAIVFMFAASILNSVFSAQGDTKTPMKVQITALALNIILDPILIYILDLGVRGAAMGTLAAFITSATLFVYYIRRKSYLELRLRCFKFSFRIIKEILTVGVPAMLMMLLVSIYMMFINRFASHFGTEYVAAFGIVFRLESVATMPILAFSVGLITLVGMFYGAERYDLLRSIISYGMKTTILITSSVGLMFILLPSLFLRIFTSDAKLLSIGSAFLRIDTLTFPLMVITMTVSRAMQGMGFGFPGLIINLVRIIFVAVPLAYLFVFVLGFNYLSIGFAMVSGGVVASILAFVWLRVKYRKIGI